MECTRPNDHFRRCVAALDRPHNVAADFRGQGDPQSQSLALQFNFQAWIRFNFIDDLVIALNQIVYRRSPAARCERAQLVYVGRNELLDFKTSILSPRPAFVERPSATGTPSFAL